MSHKVICPIPDRPSMSPSQKLSTVSPRGDITPRPVTTTLFLSFINTSPCKNSSFTTIDYIKSSYISGTIPSYASIISAATERDPVPNIKSLGLAMLSAWANPSETFPKPLT